MKHKYAITYAVIGLLLPSLLIVFFSRMWGVEITERGLAATLAGLTGSLCGIFGAVIGNEKDNDDG